MYKSKDYRKAICLVMNFRENNLLDYIYEDDYDTFLIHFIDEEFSCYPIEFILLGSLDVTVLNL